MRYFAVLCSIFYLSTSSTLFAQVPQRPPAMKEDVAARDRFEHEMLANPATGKIPEGMRTKDLKFAATLPSREDAYASGQGKFGTLSVPPVVWEPRGPENIGGRTDALGIDVANENIINAGGTSGGMWRSTDAGSTWVRTTPLDQIDNISALVQEPRAGKTNMWYCATGEPVDAPIGLPVGGGYYIGNGIFKSTDDGVTWNILRSTVSTDSASLSDPFNWVCQLLIDTSHPGQDILYAATLGGVERSSDGGATWQMTLGSFDNGSGASGIALSATGVVYAVLSEIKAEFSGTAPLYGAFRSSDGIHWTNITPPTWQRQAYYAYLAMAPSNNNVLYWCTADESWNFHFWKYTYQTGDGSGSNGIWEDRTGNLTQAGATVPYDGDIHVLPTDENTVYVGSVELWRSTDGFATPNNVTNLSNNGGLPDLHADIQTIVFYPSNPSEALVGCDGGIYYTDDDQAID